VDVSGWHAPTFQLRTAVRRSGRAASIRELKEKIMGGIIRAAVAGMAAFLLIGTTGAVAVDSPIVTAATSTLVADAKSLPNDQGADIYGVGAGKTQVPQIVKFDISAHEGPDGDFGHVGVTYYDMLGNLIVSYSANVTCVKIHTLTSSTYDRGVIRGVIKNVTPVPNQMFLDVGDTVDFGIKDGGNQSSPTPVDDFFAPSSQGVPPTAPCKAFFYTPTLNNVTQGNVNIKGP
jgi:hypothetical protein